MATSDLNDSSFWDERADVIIVSDEYEQLLGKLDRDKFDPATQDQLQDLITSDRNARATALVRTWREERLRHSEGDAA